MLQLLSYGEVDSTWWVGAKRIDIHQDLNTGASLFKTGKHWKKSGEVKFQSLVEDLTGLFNSFTLHHPFFCLRFDCFFGECRACVVVDDRLFVIGGQEGDFMAKPGSPIFKCSCRLEVCIQWTTCWSEYHHDFSFIVVCVLFLHFGGSQGGIQRYHHDFSFMFVCFLFLLLMRSIALLVLMTCCMSLLAGEKEWKRGALGVEGSRKLVILRSYCLSYWSLWSCVVLFLTEACKSL